MRPLRIALFVCNSADIPVQWDVKGGVTGMEQESRYEKFRESKQAAVKLSIAVEDFFLEGLPEKMRSDYASYITRRIRPAAELIVRQDDTEMLERLWKHFGLPGELVDELLHLSGAEHKNAAFIWLLQKKQEQTGFPLRDFSL